MPSVCPSTGKRRKFTWRLVSIPDEIFQKRSVRQGAIRTGPSEIQSCVGLLLHCTGLRFDMVAEKLGTSVGNVACSSSDGVSGPPVSQRERKAHQTLR